MRMCSRFFTPFENSRRRIRATSKRPHWKDNSGRSLRLSGRDLQAWRLHHPDQARHWTDPAFEAGSDRGDDCVFAAHVEAEDQAERLPSCRWIDHHNRRRSSGEAKLAYDVSLYGLNRVQTKNSYQSDSSWVCCNSILAITWDTKGNAGVQRSHPLLWPCQFESR